MKSEMNWFSQRIHIYQDPETSIQLQMFIDSGIVKNEDQIMETFHPCRLCILLRDTRVYSGVKYQVELKYPELIDLDKKFESIRSENIMKVFEKNENIRICKYNGNEKKILKIEFFYSHNTNQGRKIPKAKLSLKVGKEEMKSMQIDLETIRVLYRMVKHIVDNYVIISTNMSTISMFCKLNQNISNLTSKMDAIVDKMDGTVSIQSTEPIKHDYNIQEEYDSLSEEEREAYNAAAKEMADNIDKELVDELVEKVNEDDITKYIKSFPEDDIDDSNDGGGDIKKDDKPDDEPDNSNSEFEDDVNNDIQQSFDNQIGNLEDYDIGLDEFDPDVVDNKTDEDINDIPPWEDIPDKEINECNPTIKSSFIDSILDFNAIKLNEWVSAWSCSGKNTDSYGFCPLTTIISKSLVTEKFEDDGLLNAEYISGMLFKRNLRNYLENGSFLRGIPVYKFSSLIKKNTGMWRIGEEILSVYTGYSFIVSKYLNKLKNVNSGFITEMNITLEYIKNIMLSFVISMDFDDFTDSDWEEFNNDLIDIFTEIYNKEFFKGIFVKYNEISMGGSLKMSVQTIDGIFDSMINILKNKKIPSYGYKDLENICSSWNIDNSSTIISLEDVKNNILVNIEAEKVKMEDERKLNLFLQSSTKFISDEEYEDLVKKLKTYDSVKVALFNENLPDDMIIIKRIIDSNPNLKSRSDVLKKFKEFKEDLSVTESRVMSNNIREEDDDITYDTNVEDILFGSELGSEL